MLVFPGLLLIAQLSANSAPFIPECRSLDISSNQLNGTFPVGITALTRLLYVVGVKRSWHQLWRGLVGFPLVTACVPAVVWFGMCFAASGTCRIVRTSSRPFQRPFCRGRRACSTGTREHCEPQPCAYDARSSDYGVSTLTSSLCHTGIACAVCSGGAFVACPAASAELSALIDLYVSTAGPQWAHNSGWSAYGSGSDPCVNNWPGID